MGSVSGYTLDLYCDAVSEEHIFYEFPHQYLSDGKNCKAITFRAARKEGWIIKRDGTALCPKCSGKSPTILTSKE